MSRAPWRPLRLLWLGGALQLFTACSAADLASGAPPEGSGGSSGMNAATGGQGTAVWSKAPETVLRSACRSVCQERMPPGGGAPCGSLGDCVEQCASTFDFIDEGCVRCATGTLRWEAATCGAWECTCRGPTFSSIDPACAVECSATIERERARELARAAPPSVGHAPAKARLLEDPSPRDTRIAFAAGYLWLCNDAGLNLTRLDQALTPSPALVRPEFSGCSPAAGRGDTLLIGTQSSANAARSGVILSLDWMGVETARVETSDEYSPAGFAVMRDGLLAIAEGTPGRLRRANPEGTAVASSDPAVTAPLVIAGLVVQSNGTWVALVLDTVPETQSVVGLEVTRANGVLTASGRFRTSNPEWKVRDMKLAANDDVVLVGAMGQDPAVVRLSAVGETAWIWRAEATTGSVLSAVAAPDGSIYTAGIETPPAGAAGEPACAPEGCQVLAVRKFAATGVLSWQYLHREAASTTASIARGDDGQIYVTTRLLGTRSHGVRGRPEGLLVLRFDP